MRRMILSTALTIASVAGICPYSYGAPLEYPLTYRGVPEYDVVIENLRILDETWTVTIQPPEKGAKNSQVRALYDDITCYAAIGPHTLPLGRNGLLWDGPAMNDSRLINLQSVHIRVPAEVKASMLIGEQVEVNPGGDRLNSRGPGYFAPAGPDQPGLYRYMTVDKPAGLRLDLVVHPDEPGRVRLEIQQEITLLLYREPLQGVDMFVGRPILGSSSSSMTGSVPLGEWVVVGDVLAKGAESGGKFVKLIRVTEVTGDSALAAVPNTVAQVTSPEPAAAQFSAEFKVFRVLAPSVDAFRCRIADPVPLKAAIPEGAEVLCFQAFDSSLEEVLDSLEGSSAELITAPRTTLLATSAMGDPSMEQQGSRSLIKITENSPRSVQPSPSGSSVIPNDFIGKLLEEWPCLNLGIPTTGIIADVHSQKLSPGVTSLKGARFPENGVLHLGTLFSAAVDFAESKSAIDVNMAFACRTRCEPFGYRWFLKRTPEVYTEHSFRDHRVIPVGGWLGYAFEHGCGNGDWLFLLLQVEPIESTGPSILNAEDTEQQATPQTDAAP